MTMKIETIITAAAERERGEGMGLRGEALDLFVRAGAYRRHEMRVKIAQDVLRAVGKAAAAGVESTSSTGEDIALELGYVAALLDEGGIGGVFGCGGDATARLPGLHQLGKGRKQASDGGAYSAAMRCAANELQQLLVRGGSPENRSTPWRDVRVDPMDGVCGLWKDNWEIAEVCELPAAWMPWMEADASRAIIWMAHSGGATPAGALVPAPVLRWEPQAASWMLAFGPEHRRLTAELDYCRSTEAAVERNFEDSEDESPEEEILSQQLDAARAATARAEGELKELLNRMCPVNSCTPQEE